MIIEKGKRFLKRLKRNRFLKRKSAELATVRFGNDYGGFNVYIESLRTKPLIVYSFGIGEDLSFSEAILGDLNASLFAFDPTPKSIEYVKGNSISKSDQFHFSAIGLSDKNETVVFYLPQNDDWVSGSSVIKADKKDVGLDVEMKDISTIMCENGHDHIDLLKMDIEGSEFKVINGLYSLSKDSIPEIKQICVEVHDRYFDNGFDMLVDFINKLEQLGYSLINVSDTYEELTFVKEI